MSKKNQEIQRTGLEIVVVGMAGRFPGAKNIDEFWENLQKGVEAITFLTDADLEEQGIPPHVSNSENYVRARGILEEREFFDSSFFGYTPREAELMDPQMRLFYQCAWTALEDAACNPETYNGAIGLYAGGTANPFWESKALFSDSFADYFTINHLCNIDFLSTRVAHKLNLKGPAMTFQTACSTGLVAVDLGCRALLTGQCDTALAGAVSIPSVKMTGYMYEEGMVTSPDGHCRAFDDRAKGTIFSDGIGVVVLKRLEDAIADRNTIQAIILSTATNNDGIRKNSFSAPCIYGQADVIRASLRIAGVEPETIGYVETHGTGTTLGDPIEVEALKMAFNTGKRKFCGLGSVKTNIGHVDTAAGIASFIKTVLILKHGLIPPSLHFETSNSKIDFENSPFYVTHTLKKWEPGICSRRAAISSFGVGGTNTHAVLEEAPKIGSHEFPTSSPSRQQQLILISARTANALDQAADNLIAYLRANPGVNLADAAYTLQVGRKVFKHRKMLVASTVEESIALLEALPDDEAAVKIQQFAARDENQVIFMFSGQGSQYVNMGLDLYQTEPIFRAGIDRCFEILNGLLDCDIKEILYPGRGEVSAPQGEPPATCNLHLSPDINQTEITQPLIFVIEYALAKLLMQWGITPFAMMGHSIGEYVAACLAGVFSLEDALKLVAYRGRLMQQMPPGAMLSVRLPEKELIPLLKSELSLAAVNSSSLCVVSGPHRDIESFARQMEEQGYQIKKLHTSHAFHSTMMEPILTSFRDKVSGITLNKPQVPYFSNVTGTWITVEQATDPAYWAAHLRETVRFASGVTALLKEENSHYVFVEVGPGKTLSTFVSQHSLRKPGHKIINLLRHPLEKETDDYFLLNKIGQLWIYGQAIDWNTFYSGEQRLRLQLPTYPFEKKKYPIESELLDMKFNVSKPQPVLSKRPDISQWFYTPSWRRSIAQPAADTRGETIPTHWLIFINREERIGNHLWRWLKQENHDVIVVYPGNAFKEQEVDCYTVNPHDHDDYNALIKMLAAANRKPDGILHLWNITQWQGYQELASQWDERDEEFLYTGFYSLIYLVRAIGTYFGDNEVQLTVLTNNMQDVAGGEVVCPHKALILGPVMVTPQEFPHIKCRSIDILVPSPGSEKETRLIRDLAAECTSAFREGELQVALRGNYRFTRDFDPVPLAKPKESEPLGRLRQKGVYLVTGGLGGIGMVLTQHLAQQVKARLVLTGRSQFPARDQWESWLNHHPGIDSISQNIGKVRGLENSGAEVMVFQADVSDHEQMARVVARAEEVFGPINGVIHCAGLPGGGLIQLKTREIADQVLRPKVKGTLVLDRLFRHRSLDFLVLCSSINSIVPRLGQVDYYAANAFLDAFACYKNAADEFKTFFVSINWDTWQEVGMAAAAVNQPAGVGKMPHPHPLWEQYILEKPGNELYLTHLNLHRHWVLKDHMTADHMGLLPGTAYLEMVRAAASRSIDKGIMEIRDVQFSAPLLAAEGEEKEVALVLKKQGDTFEFSFFSQDSVNEENEKNLQNHVNGKILRTTPGKLKKHQIKKIEANCPIKQEIDIPGEGNITGGKGLLVFGPRWKCLKRVNYGKSQALALLELDEHLIPDLNSYKLHPALLDIATSFLYNYINASSAYIPFSYKRLTIKGDLPARLFSHSRLIEERSGRKDLIKFNVTIMNEDGEEIVDVEEFTMLEVSEGIIGRMRQSVAGKRRKPGPVPGDHSTHGEREKPGRSIFTAIAEQPDFLKQGILSAEGIDVFTRILGSKLPQVVVSTTDLPVRLEQNRISPLETHDEENQDPGQPGYDRPELSTAYAAPVTKIERMLAVTWQHVLGISQVGVHDNFFELGGDSLKAVTITGRIHKLSDIDVTLAEFFNKPTIKELARHIITGKREDRLYSIPPTEKKEYYPLSSAQKRLYILQQIEPNGIGYNLTEVSLLEGKFDIGKLEETFCQIIERHDSFRTSFKVIQNKPAQILHREFLFHSEYYDISATEGKGVEDIITNIVRPFDLSTAPLLRLGLIKIGEEKHLMALDVHHIIYDGTSMTIIYREFSALYRGEKIPALTVQYKDYAEWQNRHKQREIIKKQEKYWLNEFVGEIPLLSLPFDYPRPVIQSLEGSVLRFILGIEQTKALKDFAMQEGATLFMVLLLLYNILLAKLSSQEDFVVGTPAAGRKHPDLHPIIGIFLNTLPLRNHPNAGQSVRELLKEIKARTLAAFDNQDYPFEDLVEKVVLKRDLSRNPLFDVMFILHNEISVAETEKSFGEIKKESGLEILRYEYTKKTSQVDLCLVGFETKDRLYFEMEYCTKLFREDTIQRFVNYFNRIISPVLEDPEKKLFQLEIISEEEKNQVLYEFNNTAVQYPEKKTICQLFAEQVERTPDNIALVGQKLQITNYKLQTNHRAQITNTKPHAPLGVVNSDWSPGSITYCELNAKSNQLAQLLRENGVEPDTIVGILVERSIEMITGIFGIMKAGGAYLPLDPDYPKERIDLMLKDSNARILLMGNTFGPGKSENRMSKSRQYQTNPNVRHRYVVLNFESLIGRPCQGLSNFEFRASELDSLKLAYVIYTSGSTGRPKGVMIRHRSVINFFKGMIDVIDFNHRDRILSLTTISFDIFGLETLLPLTRGCKVIIGSMEEQLNAAAAGVIMGRERVTILQVTPSRLGLLMANQEAAASLKSLKYLLVGGESFPQQLWEKAKELSGSKIYNLYGPTETTIWSTVKNVSAGQSLNIGKPIANTQTYIVDRLNRLQPLGIAGELFIGGDGASVGYLNNPELTAEKFYRSHRSYRSYVLYRTGDLARWLVDGNIEFLGRKDYQVKVRGFRVELAEIENQLLKHRAIKEAVVLVRENETGKYICAYIVKSTSASPGEINISELRAHLARQLPAYMIPGYFIPVEKMPLTPSGKVDRKALPGPSGQRPGLKASYRAPKTGTEKFIARLWQEVLEIDQIGTNDNFFDLGGNSMKLIQLNNRLKDVINRDIPMVSMFKYPTIRLLLRFINEEEKADTVTPEEADNLQSAMDETMELMDALDDPGKES